MRQNLTNIAAKDLESLEHFYIVGSTTKEGLLDESSNVKIDLKKELAEAGGGSEEEQQKAILSYDPNDNTILHPVGLCIWNESGDFEATDSQIIFFPITVQDFASIGERTQYIYEAIDIQTAVSMQEAGTLTFGIDPNYIVSPTLTIENCIISVTYNGKTYYSIQEAS